MSPHSIKTQAIVLRRTDYGEADRIVHFLTPDGQIGAIAKGARKNRSKLAGGIEMFCLSEITAHFNRGSLGVLTSAKALQFYHRILGNFERLEFASGTLKAFSRLQNITSPAFFQIEKQVLEALDKGIDTDLARIWFSLHLTEARGEEINLYSDTKGTPLSPKKRYEWQPFERGLAEDPAGPITADHIKFLRLLSTNSLIFSAKIKNSASLLPPLLEIIKTLEN